MKSKRLLMLLLMALLVPWAANAQETVTVYNGTNENTYVPIYGLYFDDGVKCEFVIPADQLEDMANGSISAMKFYLKSVGSKTLSPTFTVFVKEVDFTTLTALTGTTGATTVFNNSITFTQNTSDVEIDIPFSSSYSYGGGNLLIGIYQNQALGSPNYTSTTWYGVNQDYNSAWSGSGSGSGRKFLPKTTFTYTPGATDCDKPTAIAVNNITPEGAVVTWEGDGNAWNLRYKASTDADYTMVNNLTSQTYPLTGLNSNTQYSVGVQTVCTGSTSLFKSTSFTTDNPCLAPTNLQITEITHESAILSWTAGYPTQASWTVKYQTSNSNWNSPQSVTVNSPTVTLENLESNKKYYVRIYACTDGEYVSGSFTTKNPCAAPTNFVVSDLTNNSAVISWTPGYTTQDSWIVKYKKNSVTSWNNAETKTVEAPTTTLDGLDENTKYDVRIYACADGSFLSGNFTTKYACSAPTNFEASNITPTSATLSWTPGYQETEWTVKYCATTATNDTITETVSGTPTLNLSGLTKLTQYNVRIYNCENYLSGSFVTAARIPLNEPFATTSIPLRWTRYKGLLGGVLADTVNLTTVSAYWNFGTTNGVFDNHAYINNYSTDHCYWLVTPALVMENNVQLSFDLALTQYYGTLQPVVDTLQSDDKFVVLIANIGADTTWTVLRQWDNQGSEYVYNNIACSAAGQNVTIDLSNYAGQNIAIAFYAESTNPTGMANTGGDNNLHIDNVSIDYIPDCSKPTGLVATEPYGHGATLSWTSDATKWVVAYKKAAAEDFTEISDITQNPYTIAGLDPETTYDVKVKSNCSGTFSDWSNTAHFTTTVACPAPTGLVATLTQGNGTIATLDWIGNASEYLVQYGITGDTLTATASDTTVALTGLTPEKNYFARVKAVCGGIDGESVWSTTITFTPTNTYPFTVNDSTYTNSYVPVYGLYCDSYSRSQFIIPATKLADMQWGEILRLTFYCNNTYDDWRNNKFNIYVMETSETTLSALVDWDDMHLVAEGIELHINSNKTMSIEFSNPYQYLGGNLLIGINQTKTDYYSSSYWYGVMATGASLGGYGTTISQQNFLPKTTFNYIPGEEPSCFKPTGFAVNNVTNHTADLTWTAGADETQWQICVNDDETNLIGVTTTSYTLTDLIPETTYTVKVRSNCGDDGYSDWTQAAEPFTTLEACPAPTTLDVTDLAPFSAKLSWTGDEESYNVRYRVAQGFNYGFETTTPWTISDFTPCSVYDGDGLTTYSIEDYSMLNANYIGSVIAFSDNSKWAAHSGNAMGAFMDAVPEDEGDTNDDYFILPELSIATGDHFIFWAKSVTANYGLERMKVGIYGGNGVLNSYLAGSADTYVEVPAVWTKYDYDLSAYVGQTIQLAINCVSADAFALLFDDLFVGNPNNDNWDRTITDVTSPYTLEGLTEETMYEWQVQTACGGEDGESDWTAGPIFVTPSACDAPVADSAINITYNSADLYWTGYQENYNVRYRVSQFDESNLSFYEDFTEGHDGWTTSGLYTEGYYPSGFGEEYFMFYTYGASEPQYLISPELQGVANGSTLWFYGEVYSSSYPEKIKIGVSTTTNDLSAFTWSPEITISSYGYPEYPLPDGVKYFAIQCTSTGYTGYLLYVSYFQIYGPEGEWINVNGTQTSPYTLAGLNPDTEYEWQVQGNNRSCEDGTTAWSQSDYFYTAPLPTQTIELSEGWNWVSFYVTNEDPEEMMLKLQKALGENGLTITNGDDYTTYEDGEWGAMGELEELNNEQMYMIEVSADCTVEMQGELADPEDYTIYIYEGWNWIGFPSAVAMSIEDAFADFEAEEGDMITNGDDFTTYEDGEWGAMGDLEEMTPGMGFMYLSNSEDVKELVFPVASRSRANAGVRSMSVKPHIGSLKINTAKPVFRLSKTAEVKQFKTKK